MLADYTRLNRQATPTKNQTELVRRAFHPVRTLTQGQGYSTGVKEFLKCTFFPLSVTLFLSKKAEVPDNQNVQFWWGVFWSI